VPRIAREWSGLMSDSYERFVRRVERIAGVTTALGLQRPANSPQSMIPLVCPDATSQDSLIIEEQEAFSALNAYVTRTSPGLC